MKSPKSSSWKLLSMIQPKDLPHNISNSKHSIPQVHSRQCINSSIKFNSKTSLVQRQTWGPGHIDHLKSSTWCDKSNRSKWHLRISITSQTAWILSSWQTKRARKLIAITSNRMIRLWRMTCLITPQVLKNLLKVCKRRQLSSLHIHIWRWCLNKCNHRRHRSSIT